MRADVEVEGAAGGGDARPGERTGGHRGLGGLPQGAAGAPHDSANPPEDLARVDRTLHERLPEQLRLVRLGLWNPALGPSRRVDRVLLHVEEDRGDVDA